MKNISIRTKPAVQELVRKLATVTYDNKFRYSKYTIHDALRNVYGKSYRDTDLMEDIRKYRQLPEPSIERIEKSIPVKYRKPIQEQEGILISLFSEIPGLVADIEPISKHSAQTKKELAAGIRRYKPPPEGRVYVNVKFLTGIVKDLESAEKIFQEEDNYMTSIIIPLTRKKEVLAALSSVVEDYGSTLSGFDDIRNYFQF